MPYPRPIQLSSIVALMGKKGAKNEGEAKSNISNNEGHNLLGSPRFKDLGNGRFRCVQTGHELPAHSKDSYSLTKHCRLGLIDSALAKNKPPLNMFEEDPFSRSKLICKLTGDIVNKSEEHIWKHINGKRFLSMLERKEVEQEAPNEVVGKNNEKKGAKKEKMEKKAETKDLDKKKKKKKQEEKVERDSSEVKEEGSVPEEDTDFWIPPVGQRWDNDDGGDRWGSDTEDEDAGEEEEPDVGEDDLEGEPHGDNHDLEVSKRKKRMSQETGASSSPSRKKVKNKKMAEGCVKGTSSDL